MIRDEDEGDNGDPFDGVVITDAQLRELFVRLTGGGTDCGLRIGRAGGVVRWAWKEPGRRGKAAFFVFTIRVQRRRPMDLSVFGTAGNPRYWDTGSRRSRAGYVADAALRALGAALGIDLAGYDPDPERAAHLSENKR